MNGSKILLTLSWLLSTCVIVQAQKKFFTDFEYPKETTINGSRGTNDFYLKIEENINYLESYLNLEFNNSQVVDVDKSYISILINDQPVETKFVKNTNQPITFKVPLKPTHIQSSFLKLSVHTNLKIRDEICDLYSYGGFWVKMNENSFLYLQHLPKDKLVTQKLINTTIPKLSQLIIPKNIDLFHAQYAAYIKFYFQRVYGQILIIKTIDEIDIATIDKSILFMPYDKLETDLASHITHLEDNDNGFITVYRNFFQDKNTNKKNYGDNLIVTGKSNLGLQKATNFLLQKNLINSAYSAYVEVDNITVNTTKTSKKEYNATFFNELDVVDKALSGIGFISDKISLPRSIFGSNVKQMEVNMIGQYRPIASEEQAYFNLYFNDQLLKSYKLDDTGDLKVNFNFDDIIMQQENKFKYEYYFVPKGGLCQISAANFYGQINTEKSYFKPVGYKSSNTLSFFRFPENFQDKPISIYADIGEDKKLINGLAEIVDIINPGESKISGFIYPPVEKATISNLNKGKNRSKIIISNKNELLTDYYGKETYISFKGKNVSYKSKELQAFFDIKYADNMGFNQLFNGKNTPVMLMSLPEDYNQEVLNSLINQIREQNLSNTGNIIVANSDDSYFFDLRVSKLYEDRDYVSFLFENFWKDYGLLLVLLIALLTITSLIYIYKKSSKFKSEIQ